MLQSEDCNGESDLDRHIAALVACHCDEWARTIGLNDASSQFREDVSKAIRSSIEILNAENSRRPSDIRKKLQRVKKEATAAANSLLKLESAIQGVTPQYRERLDDWAWGQECQPGKLDLHLILARATWVRAIGERSWAMAQIIDKGGRPAMSGFRMLAKGLGLAFKHATDRDAKVTLNAARDRYEGRFLKLVEAVLPSVRQIAKVLSLPLEVPRVRGPYVYEMTRKGSGKKRARRALPKTSSREP